jgi:hypothetical protein
LVGKPVGLRAVLAQPRHKEKTMKIKTDLKAGGSLIIQADCIEDVEAVSRTYNVSAKGTTTTDEEGDD